MANADEERYDGMEEILQIINSRFISLPFYEVKQNNRILNEVLNRLIEKFRKNPLFDGLYREKFYGGSYFINLKVGRPNEYDIDIIFTLPKCTQPEVINSNTPGFIHVCLETVDIFDKQASEAAKYPNLKAKLLDEDHYLVSAKVSAWMESVVRIALNEFENGEEIPTRYYGIVYAKIRKSGPAFTLNLKGTDVGHSFMMDIDLVPSFVFDQDNWPEEPYRSNPVKNKPEFLVVPKRPYFKYNQRYWRLSFQQQENVLINDKRNLKPSFRLLKKLRDTEKFRITSYHIKNIFLWETEGNQGVWDKSLSCVFMTMLHKFQDYIERKDIPYYWNDENNLIEEKPNSTTLANIANRLNHIICKINTNPADVAKYLLKPNEYGRFQRHLYHNSSRNH